MSFWSAEKLKSALVPGKLISNYDPKRVKHGAYELSLGSQSYTTSDPESVRRIIDTGQQIAIPPGQLCLLITEEFVSIPNNAIGFISIKATIKFQGLVNISGFHVDPGFSGRLKYTVYNAGPRPIVLTRGQPAFLIWFSDLSEESKEPYDGRHNGQSELTSDDVRTIQGEIASPGVLKEKLDELRHLVDRLIWIGGVAIGILIAISVFVLRTTWEPRAADMRTYRSSGSDVPGRDQDVDPLHDMRSPNDRGTQVSPEKPNQVPGDHDTQKKPMEKDPIPPPPREQK